MALKGKALDTRIEQELQLMLLEGFDQSPISAKKLYERLIEKNIIAGKLSTLSTPTRKELIKHYKDQQLDKTNLSVEAKVKLKNNKTVEGYKKRYQDKVQEINEIKTLLSENTGVLIDIIKEIESKTPIKVEHLLSKFLITEIIKNSED